MAGGFRFLIHRLKRRAIEAVVSLQLPAPSSGQIPMSRSREGACLLWPVKPTDRPESLPGIYQ